MLHLPYRELPTAEPGTPDTRSPLRYLIWIAAQQKILLTFNAIFGIGWMVSQALIWAAVGAAIDHGVDQQEHRRAVPLGRGRHGPGTLPGALRRAASPTGRDQLDERLLQDRPGHRLTTSPRPAPRSPTRSPPATWSTPSPRTPCASAAPTTSSRASWAPSPPGSSSRSS